MFKHKTYHSQHWPFLLNYQKLVLQRFWRAQRDRIAGIIKNVLNQILTMKCAEIEACIAGGGDANSFETYEHPVYTLLSTKSLIERAVELGCAKTVQLLIEKGATLHDESVEDFYVDLESYHRDWLFPLPIENEEELNGDCCLFLWSLFFQNVEVSQVLYKAFVVPREPHIRRKTMLASMILASEIGSLSVLRFLLARGGEELVNSNDDDCYRTPFHSFCIQGQAELVKELLERGADPNVTGDNGAIPLIDAIHNCNEEAALLLIEHGAALDVQSKDRSKPLSLAKRRKLKRVVEAIEAKLKA